jgi:hypothetical protein
MNPCPIPQCYGTNPAYSWRGLIEVHAGIDYNTTLIASTSSLAAKPWIAIRTTRASRRITGRGGHKYICGKSICYHLEPELASNYICAESSKSSVE